MDGRLRAHDPPHEGIGPTASAARAEAGHRSHAEADVATPRSTGRTHGPGFSLDEIANFLALWRDRDQASSDVEAVVARHSAEIDARSGSPGRRRGASPGSRRGAVTTTGRIAPASAARSAPPFNRTRARGPAAPARVRQVPAVGRAGAARVGRGRRPDRAGGHRRRATETARHRE